MKFRNSIFSITIAIMVIFHYPLMLKADSKITARYLLSSVDSVVLTIASDAKLLLVKSTEVDTTGRAASWNYLYSSHDSRREYYLHTENTSVIYDSSKDMRVGIGLVDSNWIDSDSALNLAELSGGYDFRTINPDNKITASLFKPVCPPFYTYWDIKYIGANSSITIRIDALTGQVITSVDQNLSRKRIPTSFELLHNYPNPFNSRTKIRFKVSHNPFVILKIINMSGQEVRILLKEEKLAGSYEVIWDGKDNCGKPVSSGIYIYQLISQDFSKAHKMMLLR